MSRCRFSLFFPKISRQLELELRSFRRLVQLASIHAVSYFLALQKRAASIESLKYMKNTSVVLRVKLLDDESP